MIQLGVCSYRLKGSEFHFEWANFAGLADLVVGEEDSG